MSKQKIIIINTGHAVDFGYKEFNTIDELRAWLKEASETMDLTRDLKVYVGEERCLEIIKGRASNNFNLSMAGCGCAKSSVVYGDEYDTRN